MKIAMATEHFLPDAGGVEIHTYELSKKLLEMGNEVHVITPRTKRITFEDKKYELDGLIIHRFSGFRIPWVNTSFTPFTLFKLKDFFKQEKFDVVHGQQITTPTAVEAASSASLMWPPTDCVVATNHSVCKRGIESFIFRLWRGPMKRMLSQIDRLIAITETASKAATSIVDKRKITVIPNGVDVHAFSPKNKGNLDVDEPVVMFVGRLVDAKGIDVLVKASREILESFPMTTFIIIGEGRKKRELTLLARKLGVQKKILFLGERKHEEICDLLASCDVFVLPSRKEAGGIVLLEAMASGKPIVSTKLGGISEIIQNGENGILVDPGDPHKLAIAVKRILDDEKLARKLKKNARRTAVKRYSWEEVAEQTFNLYKEVLEEKL